MIPTPLKLVTAASLSILTIPACTNDPVKKAIPAAGVVSYDYSQRTQKKYVNQYNQAHINTQRVISQNKPNTLHSQRAHRPRTPAVKHANYVPYSKSKDIFAVKAGYRGSSDIRTTWKEIHQGFQLENYNHKAKVRRYVRSYARMPKRMVTLNHRSSPYLPTIIAEVKRRGMPTEIALLPFVESAFNTKAYSPAKAAGLWQFIPGTARRYGLPVSSRYDARYNWKASTNAALSYLQDLNREFNGDWLLSLAAYNCGEARVRREIAKNRARGLPTDFWNLRLPKETRNYVPRLLAFKEIYGNPRAHGIHIAHIPANPNFVHASYQSANKSTANRSYKKKTAKYSKKRSKRYSKKHNKKRKKKAVKRRLVTHKVRSGETLFRIAKKYRTSVKKIMRMNGLKSTKIRAGKRLKIATRKYRRYS